MTFERAYSTQAVATMARITPRRVQLWCEAGILTCEFAGRLRRFTGEQALLVLIVAELAAKGLRPWPRAAQKIQYELGVLSRRYHKLGDRGDIRFLLVDPKQCTPAPNAETALLFAVRSRFGVLILDLHDIARRLTSNVTASRLGHSALTTGVALTASRAAHAGGVC